MNTIDIDQLAAVIGGQNHTTSPATPPGQDPKQAKQTPTKQTPTNPTDCAKLTDPIAKFYCRGGD